MYPTNGQPQAAPAFNGQGQIPYMAAPAGAPQAAPVAPVPVPQMGQQFAPAPPAQPPQQIGGGYAGPPVTQYGFNQTPAQPFAQAAPAQPYQAPPQPWPPQAPVAPPAPPPAQPPADLDAALRAQGFDNPGQLIQRLPQLQALAQYGAQALAQQGQPGQPAAAPQQPPPPAAGAAPAWEPPPYDPSWERFLDVDENTGRFVAADPALMHYANQANQHRDWLRSKSNEFWRNPYEFMAAGLKPRIESEMLKPLQEKISQLEQYIDQQQLWDAVAPYENTLYARDAQGNLTNQLTAVGQAFNAAYRASAGFSANGRPLSVEDRVRYALGQSQWQQQQQAPQYQPQQPVYQAQPPVYQQMQPQQQYQPPAFQPTPPAINPQMAAAMQQQYGGQSQQDTFLNRALERAQQAPPQPGQYAPGMGGSLLTSAELGIAQSPSQSFEALALQTARELGIQL